VARLRGSAQAQITETPSRAAWLPKSQAIQLFHHATEAAHVLLATSRKHARRSALAMHSRVARGLDVALIEHWARVVMEISRLKQTRRIAA
jgi:hypothetical protein